jgi:hypothetical protein
LKNLGKVVLAVAILFAGRAWSQAQHVRSTGYADQKGVTQSVAHDNALKQALREAVEKGLGVWLQSQTEIQCAVTTKDQILSRSEGYVLGYEILKDGPEADGMYGVTIDAQVSVDKIGADIRRLVGQLKTQLDHPSIAFVLTTWEKKGSSSTQSIDAKESSSSTAESAAGASASYQGSSNRSRSGADEDDNGSYSEDGRYGGAGAQRQADKSNSQASATVTIGRIDETIWGKLSDMGIVDAFQQEFKERGFDLKAADEARAIAAAPSLSKAGVDPSDRKAVRNLAEKEGANFVARGEVSIISHGRSSATGQPKATAKIGTEIIDVNSGDVVASYSNTVSATNESMDEAKAQAIKKAAVVAAGTLADQTIQTWQDRANNGRQFSIELRNVQSIRGQKLPFEKALKSIATISSQTSPKEKTALYGVVYKGTKSDLGIALIELLGKTSGFGEREFDGPSDEGGKIVFRFTK